MIPHEYLQEQVRLHELKQNMLFADTIEDHLRIFSLRNKVTPEHVKQPSNKPEIVRLRIKFVKDQMNMGIDRSQSEYAKLFNITVSAVHYYFTKARNEQR